MNAYPSCSPTVCTRYVSGEAVPWDGHVSSALAARAMPGCVYTEGHVSSASARAIPGYVYTQEMATGYASISTKMPASMPALHSEGSFHVNKSLTTTTTVASANARCDAAAKFQGKPIASTMMSEEDAEALRKRNAELEAMVEELKLAEQEHLQRFVQMKITDRQDFGQNLRKPDSGADSEVSALRQQVAERTVVASLAAERTEELELKLSSASHSELVLLTEVEELKQLVSRLESVEAVQKSLIFKLECSQAKEKQCADDLVLTLERANRDLVAELSAAQELKHADVGAVERLRRELTEAHQSHACEVGRLFGRLAVAERNGSRLVCQEKRIAELEAQLRDAQSEAAARKRQDQRSNLLEVLATDDCQRSQLHLPTRSASLAAADLPASDPSPRPFPTHRDEVEAGLRPGGAQPSAWSGAGSFTPVLNCESEMCRPEAAYDNQARREEQWSSPGAHTEDVERDTGEKSSCYVS